MDFPKTATKQRRWWCKTHGVVQNTLVYTAADGFTGAFCMRCWGDWMLAQGWLVECAEAPDTETPATGA